MNQKTKLAKAIALTLAGTVLTIANVSSATAGTETMYNLTTSGGADNSTNTSNPTTGGTWALSGGTDGWLYGGNGSSAGTSTSIAKWANNQGVGAENQTPFGYTGAHLNWGLEITGGAGGSAEISTNDSFSRYGIYADVDTAKGAWSDVNNGGATLAKGWRHDLDMGLFKSDTSGLVTLSAQGIMQAGTEFGFTIFKGMSNNTSYFHHGSWNSTNNAFGLSTNSLPEGSTTFTQADIVAYSVGGATPSNINTISFDAIAGEVYTIAIGGYRNGSWGDTNDGYALNVSQVPVPAAVWLMGSALLGLTGMRRKKQSI